MFNGDFFGNNYTAADFEGATGSEAGSSGGVTEYLNGSETNTSPAVMDEAPAEHEGNEVEVEEEVVEGLDDRVGRHGKPSSPVVDRFPGRAGEPVPTAQVVDANTAYESALGSALNHENPYAPFDSKMDWEVARWAKLRGSSETAFTELLAIDEVSFRVIASYI